MMLHRGRRLPRCATALITLRTAGPWCPACEWNFALFEAGRRGPESGWRWLDRLTHRVAYRLTAREFAALAGGPTGQRAATVPRVVTMVAGAVLSLVAPALLVLGGWWRRTASPVRRSCRGCWSGVALTTFGQLANVLSPVIDWKTGIFGQLTGVFQSVLSRVFWLLHVLLTWVVLRDGQRAEYRADELAARAAGSAAAARLFEPLLIAEGSGP